MPFCQKEKDPTMTRPHFILALMIAPMLLLLTGCHKDTVVGKWQGTSPGPGGTPIAMTYNFTQDNKETVGIQTQGGPVSFTVNIAGTYKVDGANLTQTITAMTMGTQTINLPPDKAKSETGPFTLDGDKLTLTNPQSKQSMTLTRVKE